MGRFHTLNEAIFLTKKKQGAKGQNRPSSTASCMDSLASFFVRYIEFAGDQGMGKDRQEGLLPVLMMTAIMSP